MSNFISDREKQRRKLVADGTRKMIMDNLSIENADEDSLTMTFSGLYLQITFAPLHPLMVIHLARSLEKSDSPKRNQTINELNLKSVFGSHSINDQVGCYFFRCTQWLDSVMSSRRFFELLERCTEEAVRGYSNLDS